MKKRLIVFFITILILFLAVYFPHAYIIRGVAGDYPVMFQMYLFHALSSIIVYVFIELVFSKIPDQTGFAFLASVFIKVGFFMLFFSGYVYKDQPLEVFEKMAIVTPFFLFLITESIFSFKLLNKAEVDPAKVLKNLDEKV